MQNRDIPNVKNILEKLYKEPNIDATAKLELISVIKQVKQAEIGFLRQRESIIDKYVLKDENGNRKKGVQKIQGNDYEVFLFGDNQDKWNSEMSRLLAMKCLIGLSIHVSALKIAETKITAQEIDYLIRIKIVKYKETFTFINNSIVKAGGIK